MLVSVACLVVEIVSAQVPEGYRFCLLILLFETRQASIYLTTGSIDAVQSVQTTYRFIYHIRWSHMIHIKHLFRHALIYY